VRAQLLRLNVSMLYRAEAAVRFQFVALVFTVFVQFGPIPKGKLDPLSNTAGSLASAAALHPGPSSPLDAKTRLCTLLPGGTLALLRVEQDTTLPSGPTGAEPMSFSGVGPGPGDSLLATPTTPMPAARVRLLQLDSTTRASLARNGVTDHQPFAFIRAAPYRADCRTIRWIDTIPFVLRGEVGYVRAILAPREHWIGGLPVLVIPDVWNYPYPRRRGLAFSASSDETLAPAEAMFSLNALLELPRPTSVEVRLASDSVKRTRTLAWARANLAAAELEPVWTLVRTAVLEPDWEVASRMPSRLRGTYRVDIEAAGGRSTWFFRTHDRPGYVWRGPNPRPRVADLVASPHVLGYNLVGYAAASRDSLLGASPARPRRTQMVWLATTDRPTTPGNDARLALAGVLEFTLAAAPESLWNDLEAFVPRQSPRDSALMARMRIPIPRDEKQPRFPLTVRLDERGGVRADTTLAAGGRAIRVLLERVDTLSIRRPF
jgi:hypothetical protein